jgi:hypothetical protein
VILGLRCAHEAAGVHIGLCGFGGAAASCRDSPDCAAPAGLVGSSKAMAERYFGGFLQGMQELGYVEGQSWTFESRYLDGDSARAPPFAEELFRLKPDVLVAGTFPGVIAFKQLTNTVPTR